MHLYSRYIAYNLLTPLLVITLTLTSIVWLTKSMRLIDLIVNNGLDISDFLYLSSLFAPLLLMIIFPVALFISVLHTYNKFMSDSELIVLNSAGLGFFGLSKPALYVALMTSLLCYAISFYMLPSSYREFKDTQIFFRNATTLSFLQEGVFNTPKKGLTVYIEEQTNDGMLKGILAHDRTNKPPLTIIAQSGRLIQSPSGLYLDVVNGYIDQGGDKIEILSFDTYSMDLSTYNKHDLSRSRESEERYLHELFFPEKSIKTKKRQQFWAEGHHRIVWPLYSFTLTFIALAALLSGQFNRRGHWKRIISACIAALVMILLDFAFKSLTATIPNAAILMYMNVLVPILICSNILYKNRALTINLPKAS